MAPRGTLRRYLRDWSGQDLTRIAVAKTVDLIAEAGVALAALIAQGPLGGTLGAVVAEGAHGDPQKALDLRANDLFVELLRRAPVAVVGSEEMAEPLVLRPGASLAVAIDPLDGSSNIDTNLSVGSIFSIYPAGSAGRGLSEALLQKGTRQLAAGYLIYGPHSALVLTLGAGTNIFTLDPATGVFRLTTRGVEISADAREFAINASNYRYWPRGVRTYIDDCLQGAEGPLDGNLNMRWLASLVAECHRILVRGGVFLYPADARKGYQAGRLRLVYEGNPIAWLVEQAGGAASDGRGRILEAAPAHLHQRTPLIFGSRSQVALIERYLQESDSSAEHAPLFAERGLFRA